MKKGNILKTFLALFTIGAFFIPQLTFAAEYYVDFTSGTDSGNCKNSGSPCQTFGAAGLAGVTAGDNVNCTGTYDGTTGADIFVTWSGSSGNPATIQQWAGQSQPVIDMDANPGAWSTGAILFTGDYITLDGFEINGTATSTSFINIGTIGSTDLTISNCQLHGMEKASKNGMGIYATDSVNLNMENNIIYDNDQNYISGGSGAYLNANRIYDTNDNNIGGLIIAEQTSPLITNNYIYGFGGGSGIIFGSPFLPPGSGASTDTQVLNNSFYANRTALNASAASGSHQFIDNIVYSGGNKYVGLYDGTGSTDYFNNLTSNFNDFYIASTDYAARYQLSGFPPVTQTYNTLADWQAATFGQDADSIGSDPLFAGLTPGSIDLDLQDTSPCKDAGTSTAPYVTTDIDGTTRPEGSAYDIGAFEIIQTPHPGVPTGLAASNITHNSADISWNAASLATNYDVEYSVNSNMTGSTTVSVSGTSTTLTGLIDGTTYYVRVRGKYYSGGWITGNWSSKINFDTLITPPSDFTVDYTTAKTAKFTWDLDEPAAAAIPDNLYIIEISTRSDFNNPIVIENIENKHYLAKQLQTSKHYFARIKSITAEEESAWSETIDFRTKPKKPNIRRVERVGDNSVNVVFKKIPRVKKMTAKLYYKSSKGWIYTGKKFSVSMNKNPRRNKIFMDDLAQGFLFKVRVRGTWKTSTKGPIHGKWSIGKTFEL